MITLNGHIYLNAKEAARYLNISHDIFYQLIKSQLTTPNISLDCQESCFRVCDLDRFLEQGMPYTQPPRLYSEDECTEILLQALGAYASRQGLSLEEVVNRLEIVPARIEIPEQVAQVIEWKKEEEQETPLPPAIAQFIAELLANDQ